MQSYISHPSGTVFNPLINFVIILLYWFVTKHVEMKIIENVIFYLSSVLLKTWYFRQLRKMGYLRWAFLRICCFSYNALIDVSNPVWYLERSDSKISSIPSFAYAANTCITCSSLLSLEQIKLTAVANWTFHVPDFWRLVIIYSK